LLKDIPDPSEQHNVARGDHEASTGAWLMEADEFKTWMSRKNSFLWLNGGGASSLTKNGYLSNASLQLELANLFCGASS
jgi:hypothetical protein